MICFTGAFPEAPLLNASVPATMTERNDLPIRRNTVLLSAALASNSAMLQLQAAVASLTLVLVLDIKGLLGLGPAIVLASGALTALPAGRLMDRIGRVPVLAGGFLVGGVGAGLTALGSVLEFAPAVLLGLVCVGAQSGTALLARAAAGDMYPPERRARGIALVLFGAVFGAVLGPAVFGPLLQGRELDGDALALLWVAAIGFAVAGFALVASVRPDPKRIAELLDTGEVPAPASQVPLREILRRPGVIPALVAAQASFAVMAGIMTLTGAVVVDHQHHAGHNVFPIIGAHVLGMYALVLVIGDVIDRIGRVRALSGGLLVMCASALSLLWVDSVAGDAAALFGLGLGWNLSFVSATAQLADASHPTERGRLLGFNDLLSGMTGASLALGGGVALTEIGVEALAVGGAVLVTGPAIWIVVNNGRAPRRPAEPSPGPA
jgi:MFS family permease